jgi:tetratricopeptide (TPR) repeat protein
MLHKNAEIMYTQMAKEFPHRVEFAVEAEYHATAIDHVAKVATGLIDGRLSAAKKFYEEHNFPKASKALNPLMIGSPSDEVIRLSALVDAQLGDLAPALAKAEKVLAKNPSDTHFFSELGKAVLTQSRPELGDTLVAIGRKSGVAETRVSILEGRLALRRKDFQKAEICFRHALRSPGADPWAYYYLGTTYLRIGELTEAINILYEGDEYLANNPRVRGSVRNAIRAKLGIAYVLDGDLPAASTILENLKGEEPDNPETLYSYWLLIVRKEGVERAEEAFEVFRNAKPKRWERGLYHLYYGLFLKALDKLDEANEHFDLAYKNEPNNVYIMIQYAENLYSLALRARKDVDIELAKDRALKCTRIVRRIFEFDPDNPAGENLQVDLYNEFDIEISGLEGEK